MNIILPLFIFTKIFLFFVLIYYYKKYGKIPTYLIQFSYNSIYYYSKLQLGFMKGTKIVQEYIDSKPLLTNFINNICVFNNKPIHNTNKFEIINNQNNQKDNAFGLKYDFIIYSDNSKSCVNKVLFNIFYNLSDKKEPIYEEANYKFIQTEIIIHNDIHIIVNFKTAENNYLIVNNKLDKKFIIYFLKKYHNITDLETTNYTVKIIDHNVNIIEFDSSKTLIINKNDYILEG